MSKKKRRKRKPIIHDGDKVSIIGKYDVVTGTIFKERR